MLKEKDIPEPNVPKYTQQRNAVTAEKASVTDKKDAVSKALDIIKNNQLGRFNTSDVTFVSNTYFGTTVSVP
ncbi:MAG: hypothetical protein J6S85_00440 [Methanobrevibacter sp.]|nr:hypothetical protein [Methanobrevibacter sp.]MBO7711999.1 hypothetical protein [Methanobrevibacter sp.]